MATSGTTGQTTYETRKVIEHALRRCKIPPQAVTSEILETANDILFTNLMSLSNLGQPLWTVDKHVIPIYRNQRSVPLPVGTVDVMNFNIRQLTRKSGTNTASEGTVANAFDADLLTSCAQTTPGGNIKVEFPSTALERIDTFGIFFSASGTWDISVQGSLDDVSWTTLYTNAAVSAVPGDWLWVDLDRQVPWQYVRLLANGSTVLNVGEFYLGGDASEIPMPKINRDQYSNLPDKTFASRPTEYWFDKTATSQGSQSIATVWPIPDLEFTYYQYVVYTKRSIQDVGTLQQELEIPSRWYRFVIADLSLECCLEIPEADSSRLPILKDDRAVQSRDAFGGESDGSSVRLSPRIAGYTK